MGEYYSDEDRAYEELQRKPRHEASPVQPQYEDTHHPETEYEDS